MVSGIHFILTYTCNFECDHCFLYCSPRSQGTFTIGQVRQVLDEAVALGSVDWIFYEGGEPFLFFPLLLESIRQARAREFSVGVVTNAYGVHSEEDALLWLEPLAAAGLTALSISNDTFHYGETTVNPAAIAASAAGRLGIETATICIDPPKAQAVPAVDGGKGGPVVGGGPKFRGRAVEKLAAGMPLRPWADLRQCPYEDLASPGRVHVDPFGSVHICQGISMGNLWKTPLAELIGAYDADSHPVCRPLLQGGPAQLARAWGLRPESGYIDECHLCFLVRRRMIHRFPQWLAPPQVYGLEQP